MKHTSSKKTTERLSHILAGHRPERVELIPILQEVEEEFGYLPREAMLEAANFTQIPASAVFGIATFYNRFRFTPLGKHPVKACMGTACHMQGGSLVSEALERELGIKVGDITHDGEFSLDRVACIGCCVLAPVVVVGEDIYPRMTSFKVEEILAELKEREASKTTHKS
jgi:NADH-quinone oxidoreductase subunit E